MDLNIDGLLEKIEGQIDAAFKNATSAYEKQFQDLVEQERKRLEKLVGEAEVENRKAKQKPQAVWTEQGGERLLILNEAAADQFNNVFDILNDLIPELNKLVKRK